MATYDLGVLGAALVVFIASLLPWYGVEIGGEFGDYSDSTIGWNSGFLAWFPVVLCLSVAGQVGAEAFRGIRGRAIGPVPPALGLTIAGGLAVLLILIRWVSLPEPEDSGLAELQVESGARVGLFLALIGAIALTAFAALRFVTSRGATSGPGAGQPPYGPGPDGRQPGQQPGGWPQNPQQQGGWQPGPQQGAWQQNPQQQGNWQQGPQG